MANYRLSGPAAVELDGILDWSEVNFHEVGRIRYARLLVQAMQDIADDPDREGVEWIRPFKRRIGVYRIWYSRNNVLDPSDRVHDPRNLVVFGVGDDGVIDILGFIHDRMLRGRALRRIVRVNEPQ